MPEGAVDGAIHIPVDELELRGRSTRETVSRFLAVAVGTGTYTAQHGLQIRITPSHLPLIATRLEGTQIRDLHDERIEATVGAVTDARVSGDDVVFEGEVGIEPHATIVRNWPDSIAFSVGFRFSPDDLDPDAEGIADLPRDFVIDHIALVGEGQDPNARLTKLLNQAQQRLTKDGMHVDKDTAAELRRQRDDALEAEKQARADLAKAESRLENTTEKLENATQAQTEAREAADQAEAHAEAARLELERAKAGFATSIMKLELKAGDDVDLHTRQQELLEMDLADLDELRLKLAEEAAEATEEDTGPATKPATPAGATGAGPASGGAMDLEELSLEDTIRLGLVKGVL